MKASYIFWIFYHSSEPVRTVLDNALLYFIFLSVIWYCLGKRLCSYLPILYLRINTGTLVGKLILLISCRYIRYCKYDHHFCWHRYPVRYIIKFGNFRRVITNIKCVLNIRLLTLCTFRKAVLSMCIKISVCGSGIRCLFDPWIRDPGGVKNQDPDLGWTSRIISTRALKQFFGLKIPYLNSRCGSGIFLTMYPGSGMGKNSDPGWKKFGSWWTSRIR